MAATTHNKANDFGHIRELLIRWGISPDVAGYGAAAVFHETGDLTSRVSRDDKNYSGIKFINNPKLQTATKGRPAPINEGGGNYAKYSSTDLWAKDYVRLLKKKPGVPANATSLADFVNRLKKNKYFTDNPANYTKGVQFFYNKYAGKAADQKAAHEAAKKEIYREEAEKAGIKLKTAGKFDFKQWIKDNPKTATAVGVLGTVLLIKAIND